MSLFQTLKTDRIQSMKDRNAVAKSILTTLVGELEGQAKRVQSDVSDAMVVQTCKKFMASNAETISYKLTSEDVIARLTSENTILTSYLPVQMSESEIREIIVGLDASNIGEVMKHLKANYAGKFNGTLASSIARELL